MSKISRNQQCPCGSGKKYKNCCLNKVSNSDYFAAPFRTRDLVSNSNHFATPFKPGERVYFQVLDSSQQPDDYVSLLDMGVAYKRRGLYEQAKEKYIEGIKINPKHFQAYYNLGKVLYIIGEYKQAVKSYKTALELGHDKIGDVMRHLGHALLDEKASDQQKHIVLNYLQSIDPFKNLTYKKPTNKEISEYDAKCAATARKYIESGLADE